jgi:hypothetical protein
MRCCSLTNAMIVLEFYIDTSSYHLIPPCCLFTYIAACSAAPGLHAKTLLRHT